jgi:type III pantothenate kinase
MNLIVDQGNSSVKIAVFDQDKLTDVRIADQLSKQLADELFARFPIENTIICSVRETDRQQSGWFRQKSCRFIVLTETTPLPIVNKYATPDTLGKDRIAAAVGANMLKPDTPLLIIDAGTAITYDIVSAQNEYLGGNISPGVFIRLRALHEFTGKLPLIEPQMPVKPFGTTTREAILSGVMQGVIFEVEGYIGMFEQMFPGLSVFLTGRGSNSFETTLKKPIFAEENLVLIGLNRILTYNVQI